MTCERFAPGAHGQPHESDDGSRNWNPRGSQPRAMPQFQHARRVFWLACCGMPVAKASARRDLLASKYGRLSAAQNRNHASGGCPIRTTWEMQRTCAVDPFLGLSPFSLRSRAWDQTGAVPTGRQVRNTLRLTFYVRMTRRPTR